LARPDLSHIAVVLVRPQHSGNIGAAARAISNHGMGRLVLVEPPAFDADRARWMAPHSHHVVDQARFCSNVESAVSGSEYVIGATARERKWEWPKLDLEGFAEKTLRPRPVSILFGPEDSGLNNEDLSHCHATVTFRTDGHHSLNLGQAVGVCGAHLLSMLPEEARLEEHVDLPGMSMVLQRSVVDTLLETLGTTNYLKSRNPLQVRNQLLRMLERAHLTHAEAANLRGMARKVYHGVRVMQEREAQTVGRTSKPEEEGAEDSHSI
jgi:TrmH family RNA methyltransferase